MASAAFVVSRTVMSKRFRKKFKRQSITKARNKKSGRKSKISREAIEQGLLLLRESALLLGMANIMDWAGVLAPKIEDIYKQANSSEEVDVNAIAEDWKLVGGDLYDVLNDRERRKALIGTSD